MINFKLLEASLLLILLLNFLRINLVVNQFVLVILALLYISFLILSFVNFTNRKFLIKLRFGLFCLIIVIAYTFVIFRPDSKLGIHDGAVLTQAATSAFLSGKNPYAISYESAFHDLNYKPLGVVYNHYMYSPLMFILNIPANLIFSGWYARNEFLVTIVVFFIMSAVVSSLVIVRERMMFLVLFLFNPVFTPLAFYGANEAIILFFLTFSILMIHRAKWMLASVSLALATGTKLLVLPFVPLYFIYLYIKLAKKQKRDFFRQAILYVLVTAIIYLPFLIWGPGDLVEDVIFYHLRGGVEFHAIAGFLGIPSVLSSLKLIKVDSSFPFYIFQILVVLGALPFIYRILRKSSGLSTLLATFVIYFSAIFVFSRIMQSSYIAFLSQVILFAAFLG